MADDCVKEDDLPYDVWRLRVIVGRLQRKIAKLKNQRDHYKERYDHYKHVINTQPFLERRWTSYEQMRKDIQYKKDLEQRVKEQSDLIKALQKELSEKAT